MVTNAVASTVAEVIRSKMDNITGNINGIISSSKGELYQEYREPDYNIDCYFEEN